MAANRPVILFRVKQLNDYIVIPITDRLPETLKAPKYCAAEMSVRIHPVMPAKRASRLFSRIPGKSMRGGRPGIMDSLFCGAVPSSRILLVLSGVTPLNLTMLPGGSPRGGHDT